MSLEDLITKYQDVKEEMTKKMADLLKPYFLEILDTTPDLVAFRWRQYTPYFNDGDTCEFSVYDPYFRFEGVSDDAGNYEDGFVDNIPYDERVDKPTETHSVKRNRYRHDFWTTPEWDAREPTMGKISSMLRNIPEEVMLAVFGDHVEITVTADGFEVEEYSHD